MKYMAQLVTGINCNQYNTVHHCNADAVLMQQFPDLLFFDKTSAAVSTTYAISGGLA